MLDAKPEVVTFGCRLNIAESETMQHLATDAGLTNVVFVNTCAVTAEAERQAGQTIRRLKRERPEIDIVVTGCASHIDPAKFANIEGVKHVMANDQKLRPESFQALAPKGSRSFSEIPVANALERIQRSFVQIQNGCDHRCTFCIIPYGRGQSRSLEFEAIAEKVKNQIAQGFEEIVLTGVDITSYGVDLPNRATLGSVVRRLLATFPLLTRLRLSSLDPAAIDEDLWDMIRYEPRLMPHLHLSLQAGDNLILKRMKRRHLREDVIRLVERARKARADMCFGADVIAGFPTETDAMFENTYKLIEQCDITWLHVFSYSSRKGTPAAKMPQVHGSFRKERSERLRELGSQAVNRHLLDLVGRSTSVLVENNGFGCTPQFAKIKLNGAGPAGKIVEVKCVASVETIVAAQIVEPV